ncbi:hypothetical protein ACWDLG_12500 [Nonomuraea sp. NPDC003727]
MLAASLADEGRTEESRRTYARAAEVFEAIGDTEAGSRCSHAVYVSQPAAVADLIRQAAA